jgi:uncharacterized protein (TIGR02268 family)
LILAWLSLGATATAQAQTPVREQQERRLTLSIRPEEPPSEVRVAPGVTTYLRFDAPLDRASLEVEGRSARFRFVDVGERIVALEPLGELSPEEKVTVRVRYLDGESPAFALFTLVSHPTWVDKELEVVRRPRSLEALEAALAEREAEIAALRARSGLAELVFSGRLGVAGVRAQRFGVLPKVGPSGLQVVTGMGYRADSWTLVVVRVLNLPGQKPWMPTEARLIRADGTRVKVRAVDLNPARLAPGEEGLVAVETDAPSWKTEEDLRLELEDKGGRRLLLPSVKL